MEQVPASRAHSYVEMLVFTSPLDQTVEEVVVTVTCRQGQDAWALDLIDREALPLVEPVEWQPGEARDAPRSLTALSDAVAALEERIVNTLNDLRFGF